MGAPPAEAGGVSAFGKSRFGTADARRWEEKRVCEDGGRWLRFVQFFDCAARVFRGLGAPVEFGGGFVGFVLAQRAARSAEMLGLWPRRSARGGVAVKRGKRPMVMSDIDPPFVRNTRSRVLRAGGRKVRGKGVSFQRSGSCRHYAGTRMSPRGGQERNVCPAEETSGCTRLMNRTRCG